MTFRVRLAGSVAAAIAIGIPMGAAPAGAQESIRDQVKQHVDTELDRSQKPGPPKKVPDKPAGDEPKLVPRPTAAQPANGQDKDAATYNLTLDDLTTSKATTDLPRRVIGDYLRLDMKVDAAYRGWVPQQYDAAKVAVAGYYTWSIDVRGKLFKLLNLRRGYYESNALSAPRTSEAAVATQVGSHVPKAAWAMAMLGVPVLKVWEPTILYEARAFNTSARATKPVCIVRRGADTNMACNSTTNPDTAIGDQLNVISAFETLVLGVRWDSGGDSGTVIGSQGGRIPPILFGLGLMQYTKPYQVTIDGRTLDTHIFDGRFRGAGLALGTNLGGGVRQFFADVNMQIGLGEVELARDLTLNELAPDDWLIGYVQGTVNAGYRFVLVEGPPTLFFTPTLSGGGASFHFFQMNLEEGETGNTPNLNWDFLWSVRAALEISL